MNTHPAADGAVGLSHWGVIRAHGDDAAAFLHGQLTNSVTTLDGTRANLAGYCSAKGRLLASFVVWRAADGDLLLACHASVLAATLKRLSMFVLRAKCKLSDATSELPLWGLAGSTAAVATAGLAVWGQRADGDATVIRLPDAEGGPRALRIGTAPAAAALDAAQWMALEIASGVPVIEAATADQFVPQMLNFELIGGVDFAKGCYPGQEVVARSQYRGTIKRRLFRFECGAVASPGQEVFAAADPTQPAGLVCNVAAAGGGSTLLAEVKLAAMAEGRLGLGAADGPALRPLALPYDIPAADAALP